MSILALADLVDAYETLGGVLPEDLREHVEALNAEWTARANARSARTNAKKIGRNDPCPCASGKKFKKCCLGNTSHRKEGVGSSSASEAA